MPILNCCKLKQKELQLRHAAAFMDKISEPNRLNILRILRRGELSVTEICLFLDLPQNLVSHHLKVLKDFRLLNSQKDGKKIIYFLNKEVLKQYKSLIIKFI